MRRLVVASLEDAGGDRCVDILRDDAGFAWVECRRDPEDAHGWRHLHPPRAGFPDAATARADATLAVGWLTACRAPDHATDTIFPRGGEQQ